MKNNNKLKKIARSRLFRTFLILVIIAVLWFLIGTSSSSEMKELRKVEKIMDFPSSSINMRGETDKGQESNPYFGTNSYERHIVLRVFGPEIIKQGQDNILRTPGWARVGAKYGDPNVLVNQDKNICVKGLIPPSSSDDATIFIGNGADEDCKEYFKNTY